MNEVTDSEFDLEVRRFYDQEDLTNNTWSEESKRTQMLWRRAYSEALKGRKSGRLEQVAKGIRAERIAQHEESKAHAQRALDDAAVIEYREKLAGPGSPPSPWGGLNDHSQDMWRRRHREALKLCDHSDTDSAGNCTMPGCDYNSDIDQDAHDAVYADAIEQDRLREELTSTRVYYEGKEIAKTLPWSHLTDGQIETWRGLYRSEVIAHKQSIDREWSRVREYYETHSLTGERWEDITPGRHENWRLVYRARRQLDIRKDVTSESVEKVKVTTGKDMINSPSHYTSLGVSCSGCGEPIECIDITEKFMGNLSNVIRYVWRTDEKDTPESNLKKARWYINRELKRRGIADD